MIELLPVFGMLTERLVRSSENVGVTVTLLPGIVKVAVLLNGPSHVTATALLFASFTLKPLGKYLLSGVAVKVTVSFTLAEVGLAVTLPPSAGLTTLTLYSVLGLTIVTVRSKPS